MKKTRVVVGMSGGVDSSVTAYLLQKQGFEVIGVTMKLWPQDCAAIIEDKCCGPQAMMDARSVAHQIGIPHYVVDDQALFQKKVVDYFAAEYKSGRTPNPCILCNELVKFGSLLDRAREMGAEFVATGHYARIEKAGENGNTCWLLKRGRDLRKDQSYFLFSLRQDQLASSLMPLGELSKTETRTLAAELGLKVADKEESMEICFVPGNDYGKFLRETMHIAPRQGEIVDIKGRVLGRHMGIENFTIGQRKGLGIASEKALYVVALEVETNRVIVGDNQDLAASEFIAEAMRWIPFDPPNKVIECTVKIRHGHEATAATVTLLEGDCVRVKLHEPQRAVTPGQAAVFYDGDLVLGGGWIRGQ
jgi:tRNA-specific 2-thiouridylase